MFVRDCPGCGEELSYSSKSNLTRAIKLNKKCNSCSKIDNPSKAHLGKNFTEEHRYNLSISHGGTGKTRKWPRHGTWAKRVKERDGCCQKCSSTENLHAHHLIPKALFPQNAYVVSNDITLCKDCHIELHKILSQN